LTEVKEAIIGSLTLNH